MGNTSHVTTRRLNYFWQKAVKPLKTLLGSKDITNVGETVTDAIDNLDVQLTGGGGTLKFDKTKEYLSGEYCIYNDKLYRSTVKISANTEFSINNWKETDIYTEIYYFAGNLALNGQCPPAGTFSYDFSKLSGKKFLLVTTKSIYSIIVWSANLRIDTIVNGNDVTISSTNKILTIKNSSTSVSNYFSLH